MCVLSHMKPRKGREFIKEHAKARGVPEGDMEDMIQGYYDTIRKHVTGLEDIRIKLRGIGLLKISNRRVAEEIVKLQQLTVQDNQYWGEQHRAANMLTRLHKVAEMIQKEDEYVYIQQQEKLRYKEQKNKKL